MKGYLFGVDSDVLIWGHSAADRVCRVFTAAGGRLAAAEAITPADGMVLLFNADCLIDEGSLKATADKGELIVVDADGRTPLHARLDASRLVGRSAQDVLAALLARGAVPVIAAADLPHIYSKLLRRQVAPTFRLVRAVDRLAIERALYDSVYKGVTDFMTKYAWPGLAFHLTRLANALRMTPHMVTTVGLTFCILATWLFWRGDFLVGCLAGWVFCVLDTVDGKLARVTFQSSRIGDIYDHGIDLVHPPIWYWAWGLAASQNSGDAVALFAVIMGGYLIGRLLEGIFASVAGFYIWVWRPIDSQFRLIVARRNPNFVLMTLGALAGSPLLGIQAVAWWTVACTLLQLVQFGQAAIAYGKGRKLTSWLEQP